MSGQAAETLAAAFMTDPGFIWVLPDSSHRCRRLEAIFAGSIAHADRHGGVVSLDHDRAVGVWLPDTKALIGPIDAARGKMLTLPITVGLRSMRRLDRAEKEGESFLHRHLTSPYAYLMALGVHPDRQGLGIATRVIEQVANQARTVGYRTLALRTEKPSNIGLYQHLGFHLHAEHTAPTSQLSVAVMSKPI